MLSNSLSLSLARSLALSLSLPASHSNPPPCLALEREACLTCDKCYLLARKVVAFWVFDKIIKSIISDLIEYFLGISIVKKNRIAVKCMETNFIFISCQRNHLTFPTPRYPFYEVFRQFPIFEKILHYMACVFGELSVWNLFHLTGLPPQI